MTTSSAQLRAFSVWFGKVDDKVLDIAGVSASDLADQPYWDWFADGTTPREAAQQLLEDEGFPF